MRPLEWQEPEGEPQGDNPSVPLTGGGHRAPVVAVAVSLQKGKLSETRITHLLILVHADKFMPLVNAQGSFAVLVEESVRPLASILCKVESDKVGKVWVTFSERVVCEGEP